MKPVNYDTIHFKKHNQQTLSSYKKEFVVMFLSGSVKVFNFVLHSNTQYIDRFVLWAAKTLGSTA